MFKNLEVDEKDDPSGAFLQAVLDYNSHHPFLEMMGVLVKRECMGGKEKVISIILKLDLHFLNKCKISLVLLFLFAIFIFHWDKTNK